MQHSSSLTQPEDSTSREQWQEDMNTSQQTRRYLVGEEWGLQPTLALVFVGADPASIHCARTIKRTCEGSGVSFQAYTQPTDIRESEMVDLVRELSADEMVHGIVLQRPMPEGINDAVVIEALDPAKDVDGAHPLNAGRLAQAAFVDRPQDVGPYFVPVTPLGGLELLQRYRIQIDGQRAVIIAASNLRQTLGHAPALSLGDGDRLRPAHLPAG